MWRAVVSQPLDRAAQLEALGEIDHEAGEFWVENPFQMPRLGHNLSAYESNCVFMNVDGRRFWDVSFASQADLDSDSRAVIVGDFNGDERVDLLVGSVGGGPLRLFSNQFPDDHHRIHLDLHGSGRSNAWGIGSRVTLRLGSGTVTRDLFPANGFMGQSPVDGWIGVGKAQVIDELCVRWPSGRRQRWTHVPVDHRLEIHEGRADYRSLSF